MARYSSSRRTASSDTDVTPEAQRLDKVSLFKIVWRKFRKEVPATIKLEDDDDLTEGYVSDEAYCEYGHNHSFGATYAILQRSHPCFSYH